MDILTTTATTDELLGMDILTATATTDEFLSMDILTTTATTDKLLSMDIPAKVQCKVSKKMQARKFVQQN